MTEQQQVPPTPQPMGPPWRGINHLALITDDMDATVRFYHGTLGARLVATIGTSDFKHYFFEFGPECTVAFFEYASIKHERLAKGAGILIRSRSSSITCRSTSPTKRHCSISSAA